MLYFLPLAIYVLFACISATYAMTLAPAGLVVRWFLMLWVGLFVELVACLITPVVVVFADPGTGRLPDGFHWMETQDALLPGYPPEQGFQVPRPTTWGGFYWQSVRWLYRNRVYRFTTEQMGVLCVAGAPRTHIGEESVSDEPPVHLGLLVEYSGDCFEIHRVFTALGRVWEWRIGYKMAWTIGRTAYAQHVLRIRSGSKEV